ncbi:VOC family protein [Altibacter sp. HG106]|uniref:VOC family protein n=1 Tax=Altibacter sp. HG106 TaxID=3023937 RepID=UPI00235083BC|nr:VOC family protein [Altibacter sp. HG106]MDC7994901.1 VOC family protein [Altibacter sp. HG106]
MNLNQVTVPAINVAASVAFYEALGLQLIVYTEDTYARFECPKGGSTFSVHKVDNLPKGSGVYTYFEVNDVAAKVTELRTKGIAVDEGPVEQSWLWTEARLRDPSNNQIIIYHAGDHRKNPPWRISNDAGN